VTPRAPRASKLDAKANALGSPTFCEEKLG
jgi:hypothetical protein